MNDFQTVPLHLAPGRYWLGDAWHAVPGADRFEVLGSVEPNSPGAYVQDRGSAIYAVGVTDPGSPDHYVDQEGRTYQIKSGLFGAIPAEVCRFQKQEFDSGHQPGQTIGHFITFNEQFTCAATPETLSFGPVVVEFVGHNTPSVILPPGKYWIGDPSYVTYEDDWTSPATAAGAGQVHQQPAASFDTHSGDGTYRDQNGRAYAVDTGRIAAVPHAVCRLDRTEIPLDQLSNLIEFPGSFLCRRTRLGLTFGHIEIATF